MKPALHRSVWFWLGCFVLLFVVWVWVDSWKTTREVRRELAVGGTGSGPVLRDPRTNLRMLGGAPIGGAGIGEPWWYKDSVVVNRGYISMQRFRVTLTDPRQKMTYFPVNYRRYPADGGVVVLKPRVMRSESKVKGARVVRDVVVVPMWCVVLAYVMMCGGVVWWSRRRWRRVMLMSGGGETEGGVIA